MPTTTNLSTLKINYLTQAQYDAALSNNTINENEIYLTPSPAVTPITAGGTGAVNASGARTNLGLGTIATHAEGDYVTTSGNAASATYASNIRVTTIAPTTGTSYNLIMSSGTTANTNYNPLVHNAISIYADADSTNGLTKANLLVGSNTVQGGIKLYNTVGYAVNLIADNDITDSNKLITFPNANGTILTTAGGQTLNNYMIFDYDTDNSDVIAISARRASLTSNKQGVRMEAKNTSSGLATAVAIGSGGKNHGIISNGYYNGTTYTSDSKWIAYRNGSGDIILNGHSTEDLALTGGTLTGDLIADFTGTSSDTVYPITATRNAPGTTGAGVGIIARNTGSGLSVNISIGNGGQNHGLYSSGYYDGTTYTQSGSWMVYRNSSGKVLFNIANNGNVVLSNQGRYIYITSTNAVPSGAKAGDIVLVKA